MAYDQIGVLPDRRADYHAALIAMTLANSFRGKNDRVYTLEDFLIRFGPEAQPDLSTESVVELFRAFGVMPTYRKH